MKKLIWNKILTVSLCFIMIINLTATVFANTDDTEEKVKFNGKVTDNILFSDEEYVAAQSVLIEDGTYQIVIVCSKDKGEWFEEIKLTDVYSQEPKEIKFKILNERHVLHFRVGDNYFLQIENEDKTWTKVTESYGFCDLIYDNGAYYAVDKKVNLYKSNNLETWTRLTDRTGVSSSVKGLCIEKIGLNLVVSHYETKWGINNYNNGLEVYDLVEKKWLTTKGFTQTKGVVYDLVNTGEELVVVHGNIYLKSAPISVYTSTDGINYVELKSSVKAIQKLLPFMAGDSAVYKTVDLMRQDITKQCNAGIAVPIDTMKDGVAYDSGAILMNNRVYMPIRKLFELMDGKVEWTPEKLTGITDTHSFVISLNSKVAYCNDEIIFIDEPFLMNNTTYVPVRAIAENAGYEVEWDYLTYTINIISK